MSRPPADYDQPLPPGRGGVRHTFLAGQVAYPGGPARHPVSGVLVDGAVYPLDGQPPPARGGSWGEMGWLLWRWEAGRWW